jgi:hypothetical protein
VAILRKNQATHAMTSHDYLVEMSFAPFASLPSPQEVVTFGERFALPTLEALERLAATGQIVAGGPALASVGFAFIARASSPQELEDMVAGLPLWARAQTRVVALGTFNSRAATIRVRLQKAREAAAQQPLSR